MCLRTFGPSWRRPGQENNGTASIAKSKVVEETSRPIVSPNNKMKIGSKHGMSCHPIRSIIRVFEKRIKKNFRISFAVERVARQRDKASSLEVFQHGGEGQTSKCSFNVNPLSFIHRNDARQNNRFSLLWFCFRLRSGCKNLHTQL